MISAKIQGHAERTDEGGRRREEREKGCNEEVQRKRERDRDRQTDRERETERRWKKRKKEGKNGDDLPPPSLPRLASSQQRRREELERQHTVLRR